MTNMKNVKIIAPAYDREDVVTSCGLAEHCTHVYAGGTMRTGGLFEPYQIAQAYSQAAMANLEKAFPNQQQSAESQRLEQDALATLRGTYGSIDQKVVPIRPQQTETYRTLVDELHALPAYDMAV